MASTLTAGLALVLLAAVVIVARGFVADQRPPGVCVGCGERATPS